ncbi:hypothetical protein [Chromohalobacter israelensis]|uniref:Uncharacterized protein n=1 Tax=Chromohalobacter israelensis (strain ATCC BAA-138 / DSM 3043 / CIP 106854 / NCIMB 13768 / 1H11) TaxID=290398 RepID=Q1QZL4_CHRI1|nr:hypothetical protein [Chromohalobacter salexigens]ABE58094.1 hypothetical protein Csal_0733 [Chromohalobacter salexigens DSM 3043]
MLSDESLRNTLEPAVVVMNAFKKASSWKVVYAAWTASKQQDRWYFIGLSAIFLALGTICIWLNNSWIFIFSLAFGSMGIFIFRFRIIDRHPIRNTYGQLDRHFGINHRFRRYLIFRHHLQSAGIDSNTINRVRRILAAESKLQESRRPKLDFLAGAAVSIVAGLSVAMSTQEHLIKSGWTLIILVAFMVSLYFYLLWKSVFPGQRHTEQELECFLTWHEEEHAFSKRN